MLRSCFDGEMEREGWEGVDGGEGGGVCDTKIIKGMQTPLHKVIFGFRHNFPARCGDFAGLVQGLERLKAPVEAGVFKEVA